MILNSIRARMTALFSLVTAVVMVCACGGLIIYSKFAAESNAAALLNVAARRIRSEINGAEHIDDFKSLLEEERDFLVDGFTLMLVDQQGKTIVKSQSRVPAWPNPPPGSWRVQTVPFRSDTVVIGLRWDKTQNMLNEQSLGFIAFGTIVLMLTGVGAWLLVGRTLSPIGSLSTQAQSASADSLRITLTPPSQDSEIVGLVATLNSMLGRLAQTTESKARFYAAASHELRNPLQALSGHLELSQSRPRTDEEKSETIREAYIQTQRLVSLVRDLLTLNRLEFLESSTQKEWVVVSDICHAAINQFESLVKMRHLKLRVEIEDTEILTLPSHAEMFIRNLIENAVKYSPENGAVRIDLKGRELTIFNTLPDSIHLDTEQLFEAFYRPDASRNSETGGNGLGLAICKAIAQANAWHLTLAQIDGGIKCHVKFRDE